MCEYSQILYTLMYQICVVLIFAYYLAIKYFKKFKTILLTIKNYCRHINNYLQITLLNPTLVTFFLLW